MEKVWTCETGGANFTEHIINPFKEGIDPYTLCNITYTDVPLEFTPKFIEANPLLAEYKDERCWYTDHDRDDVINCVECFNLVSNLI